MIAAEMRWKRLISPHGTCQRPKSRSSSADASSSVELPRRRIARQPCSRRLMLPRRPSASAALSVPPKKGERFATEARPSGIPGAEDSDRRRQPHAEWIAFGQSVERGDERRDQLARTRAGSVSNAAALGVEGPAAASGEQLDGVEAAEVLSVRIHVLGKVARFGLNAPAARYGQALVFCTQPLGGPTTLGDSPSGCRPPVGGRVAAIDRPGVVEAVVAARDQLRVEVGNLPLVVGEDRVVRAVGLELGDCMYAARSVALVRRKLCCSASTGRSIIRRRSSGCCPRGRSGRGG